MADVTTARKFWEAREWINLITNGVLGIILQQPGGVGLVFLQKVVKGLLSRLL